MFKNWKNKLIELARLNNKKKSTIEIHNSKLAKSVLLSENTKIINSFLSFSGKVGNNTLIKDTIIEGEFYSDDGCRLNRCELNGNVSLGRYSSLWGPNLDIYTGAQKVTIGSFCSIARNVSIQAFNHNSKKITTYFIGQNLFKEKWKNERVSKGDIVIQNDVWIGTQTVIMGGVTIGNGAIIAANSVVTKDVPPFSIVAGLPAKVISFRFSEKKIKEIQKLAWWDWSVDKIKENKELFLKAVED